MRPNWRKRRSSRVEETRGGDSGRVVTKIRLGSRQGRSGRERNRLKRDGLRECISSMRTPYRTEPSHAASSHVRLWGAASPERRNAEASTTEPATDASGGCSTNSPRGQRFRRNRTSRREEMTKQTQFPQRRPDRKATDPEQRVRRRLPLPIPPLTTSNARCLRPVCGTASSPPLIEW